MVDRLQISVAESGKILAEARISAPDEGACARAEVTMARVISRSAPATRWQTLSMRVRRFVWYR